MKLKVFTANGASSADKDFDIPVFEGEKGLKAVKQVVVSYLANKRQGTSNTLTSSTVHGTGKKPFRQKGTGMARQGARNRVQHYHGAVSHGPHPRDWTQKISKKLKRLALSRALYDRANAGDIEVIEQWNVEQPKTKLFNGVLKNIDGGSRKILVVDDSWSDDTILAARNISRITISEAREINALDLTRYDKIIVSEKGIETILNRTKGAN